MKTLWRLTKGAARWCRRRWGFLLKAQVGLGLTTNLLKLKVQWAFMPAGEPTNLL